MLEMVPIDPPSTINQTAFEIFRYNWLKDLLETMKREGNERPYPFQSVDSHSENISFFLGRLVSIPSRRFTYGTIYETLIALEPALKAQNWASSVFDVYDILPDGDEEMVARGDIVSQADIGHD